MNHRRARQVLVLALLVSGFAACKRVELRDGPVLKAGNTAPVIPEDPCPPPPFQGLNVVINEFMLENTGSVIDDLGLVPPAWVELYNFSGEPVDLSGAGLSDDLFTPDKWEIPCIPAAVIPAGGYLLIYLDGDVVNEEDLHANFIPALGGELTLVLNGGSDLLEFDADTLAADQSAGRYLGGGDALVVLEVPTPGAENAAPLFPPEVPFVRGDVTFDELVNEDDVLLLSQMISEIAPRPNCLDRLDVNDDGTIDIADLNYLIEALFDGGAPVPAPFPVPGSDPSPDKLTCFAEGP
ncbi:MAG: dockerin type I domain-containing protein [Planctomycetota bacterium]